MSISVGQLSKVYGVQKALNNVSFQIKTGEVVGLLGPNGAGKSTLMKILSCFIPQTSGSAIICGYDVREQSMEVKKKVGYLPENNPLYLDMYVREYLEFIGGIHKIGRNTKQRVNEIIELTGLELEQKKKIGQLSKGYRQRIGMAQALFHNPDVLILDEPTSGLDPIQLLEIRKLIKRIGKEKTILLSTHIMQEVEAVCDRIIIIHKGKIVTDDSTVNVQKTSANEDTILIEFSAEIDFESIKNIETVLTAKIIQNNVWEICASGEKDIRPELFKLAVDKGITVLSMQRKEKSMEDVFHQATK